MVFLEGRPIRCQMIDTKKTLNRFGLVLCAVAAILCFALHVATFLTELSPVWGVPALLILFGAVICASVGGSTQEVSRPLSKLEILGFVLLAYSVLTFVYFYRTTGGASSVNIVNGQYVSESKGHIIRTISAVEFRMFPNLWTRVMSAWIGMMAVFCARSFAKHPNAN